MVDGSTAIHPHNLGLLMVRGMFSTGPFGQAKQCVINAFDTNYMLSADEMMACILHLAYNMDEEAAPGATAPDTSPLPYLRLSLPAAVHTAFEDTPTWPSWWSRPPPQVQRMWQPAPHIVLMYCPR
jgi:hypothetical protein